ncbi:MAG: sigma-54-dependent Fis family transcriptional regulator [bacterium]|nr:sigma-54-dependent Fis family transcriptional regulator [bacterium]
MTKNVVLIDDEQAMRRSVEQWLDLSDFNVRSFSNGHEALRELSADFDGVIVSDVKMPGIDGMEVLDAVINIDTQIPVILITGHGEVAMAVEAMKRSAHDFLEKPFSPERLLEVVSRAHDHRTLVLENRRLRGKLADISGLKKRLIGDSKAIQALRNEITDLASTNVNILLQGETGTGKEVIARALHDFSNRTTNHFTAIDCGAIPSDLFESEFFGHQAGAFTGAINKKIGFFEHANHGTIFLDEIVNLHFAMQAKLLRVLQERQITPVGANKAVDIDIRLVSATNETIDKAIKEERFRADLYYRINTIELYVPPLRERGDDVILLFEHFVQIAEREFKRDAPVLSANDLAKLRSHAWPGNVRELKNIAERFTLWRGTGYARISELMQGAKPHKDSANCTLKDQMNNFERDVIASSLAKYEGNISDVMLDLSLPRRTLNDKMVKYGLAKEKYS